MKYYFVLSPISLEQSLISESKRLMKTIYDKDVNNIYYRVKTKNILDNPRRLFIKGDGRVLETEVKPHISLVHNIELESINDFIQKAKAICEKHQVFDLEFAGLGNYGMDFTFFVEFKPSYELEIIRSQLLELSRPYLSDEEYRQHLDAVYTPHSTLLYDDIDPEKVTNAYKLLNIGQFSTPITVKEILLWEVTPTQQKVVARFPLNPVLS